MQEGISTILASRLSESFGVFPEGGGNINVTRELSNYVEDISKILETRVSEKNLVRAQGI